MIATERRRLFVCSALVVFLSQGSLLEGFVPFVLKRVRPRVSLSSTPLETTALQVVVDDDNDNDDDGVGVGIDLGTTYSAVALLRDCMPTIIPVPNNGRTMPSVVNLDSEGNACVGKEAIDLEVDYPLGTYRNVKRVIGMGSKNVIGVASVVPNLSVRQQDLESNAKERQKKNKNKKNKKKNKKDKEDSLVKQLENARTNPAQLLLPPDEDGNRETVPTEVVSSHVLRRLFDVAEEATAKKVTRAVIGVPAYFNDAQREATVRASELAGVPKVKLLCEPEAAALAYGVGKEQVGQGDQDELVLVFDLGGGTYDVSVLLVGGGLTEVLSTSGDAKLGGTDFDLRIAEYFAKELLENGAERNYLKRGTEASDAMVRAAEAVRIYLSNNREVVTALPLSAEDWATLEHARDVILGNQWTEEMGSGNSTHVFCQLNRQQMERLCKNEFQALLRPIREVAIASGALLPGDSRPTVVDALFAMEEEIGEAIIVESATAKKELAFGDFYVAESESKELAGQAAVATPEELEGIDPDTLLKLQEIDLKERKKAQQRGRKRARDVSKQEMKFSAEKRKLEANPSGAKVRDSIGGRPISRVVLVGGATRMPAIGRLLAAVTGVVPQKTVNPDEAVALGCAVRVGVLDGEEGLGLTVLNPMQAAVMRAIVEKEGLLTKGSPEPDFAGFDDDLSDFDYDESDIEMIEFGSTETA